MKDRIKVLVVDDSALMRKMIPMIISSDKDIDVVGTAMDGDFALSKIPALMPDVVTLDIDMPRMDGLTTLNAIVNDFRIPVILVSSLTKEGAEVTLRGLEMGAFDFVPKPREAISIHISEISSELIDKVKAAAGSKPLRFRELPKAKNKLKAKVTEMDSRSAEHAVAIGISTGGPQALAEILPRIPEGFPLGVLVVQHMPAGFTELFAKRLDAMCSINVKEASDGDMVSPGTALIAPGGSHLKVKRTAFGVISVLSRSKPVSGHRPSVDLLFDSVAEEYGSNAVGVIMTGMGIDGVEGIGRIKSNGGVTIAQDEKTSVIYGMPKVASEKGYIDEVLGLDEIVPRLIEISEHRSLRSPVKKNAVTVPG